MSKPLFGLVEAGGTKFVCAVATGPEDVRDEVRFPTAEPEATLTQTLSYFREAERRWGKLSALGIGCFGPVDLNPASPTWGYVTATPKPGWQDTEVAGRLARALGVPVGFDTDVNGAALGEHLWGAGQGLNNLVYLTVGTGVGGGVLINGQLVHGLVHPEVGHFLVVPDPSDPFPGLCPYHGHCVEGMAAGPAIEKRWGRKAYDLDPNHKAWTLEANYLAQACLAYLTCFSPERIILGGGVMEQTHLFPLIQNQLLTLNNHYLRSPALTKEGITSYLVPPGLGNKAGILGALALAQAALARA
ncbi:MAG: ROK family protein [Spirochaetales bacterium]|nr:ROK family protein [Spirochaetales bacterium]